MQRKGKIFPEFTYVVDKTKAYEFAKAIGDELRQVEGEFFVPIGMMIFVVVQDGESIFQALNVTWKQVFLGGVKLKYHRPMKVGESRAIVSFFLSLSQRRRVRASRKITAVVVQGKYTRDW